MKSKFRIYAIFQFASFIQLLSLLAAIILLEYQASINNTNILDTNFWISALKDVLKFVKQSAIGIFASLFVYATILLWVFTMVTGITIFSIKNRNIIDSIFLFFFFIPLISNTLALMAQMSLRTIDYASSKVDREQIEKETLRIIEEEKKLAKK